MALNNLGLGVSFTVPRDQLTPKLRDTRGKFIKAGQAADGFQRQLGGVSGAMGNVARAFATGFLARGPARALLGVADTAGIFEQTLAGLGVRTNATAKELGLLRDRAIDAALATEFSPQQAVEGLQQLGIAGFAAREQMEALQPVLEFTTASGGLLGVADSAALASQALNAFGLEASDTRAVMDSMAKLASTSAFNFNELRLALGTVVRGSQAASQSLNETLSAMALVRNIVPRVQKGATSLAVAMERLPKKAFAKAFPETEIADAQGNFRDFLDIIEELRPGLMRMTETARALKLEEAFGAEGKLSVQAILSQLTTGVRSLGGIGGKAAVDMLRKTLGEGSKGAVEEFTKALLGTFKGQKQLLGGAIQGLAVVIGKPIADALQPLASLALATINKIIKSFRGLSESMKKNIGILLIAIVTLTSGFAAFLSLQFLMKTFGLSFGKMMKGILRAALPILAISIAITALIAIFNSLDKETKKNIFAGITAAFEKVKLIFRGLVQAFSQGGFSGAVMKDLNKAENAGIKKFIIAVFSLGKKLQALFIGVGKGIASAVDQIMPVLEVLWGGFAFLLGIIVKVQKFIAVDLFSAFVGIAAPMQEAERNGKGIGEVLGGIAVGSVLVWAGFKLIRSMMFIWGLMTTLIKGARFALIVFRATAMALNTTFKITRALFIAKAIVIGTYNAFMALAVALTGGLTLASLGLILVWVAAIAIVGFLAFKVGQMVDEWLGLSDAISDGIVKAAEFFGLIDEAPDVPEFSTREEANRNLGRPQRPAPVAVPPELAAANGPAPVPAAPAVAPANAAGAAGGIPGLGQLSDLDLAAFTGGAGPQSSTFNLNTFLNIDGEQLAQAQQSGIRTDRSLAFAAGAGAGEE